MPHRFHLPHHRWPPLRAGLVLALALAVLGLAADARAAKPVPRHPLPFSAWQRPALLPFFHKLQFSAPQVVSDAGGNHFHVFDVRRGFFRRKIFDVMVPLDKNGVRGGLSTAIATWDHNGALAPDRARVFDGGKGGLKKFGNIWSHRVANAAKAAVTEDLPPGSFGYRVMQAAGQPTKVTTYQMGDVIIMKGHGSSKAGLEVLSGDLRMQAQQAVEIAEQVNAKRIVFSACSANQCVGQNGLGALVEEMSEGRVRAIGPTRPGALTSPTIDRYGNDRLLAHVFPDRKSAGVPTDFDHLASKIPVQRFSWWRFGVTMGVGVAFGSAADHITTALTGNHHLGFLAGYLVGDTYGLLFGMVLYGTPFLEALAASLQVAPFALPAAYSIHLANAYSSAIDDLVALHEKSSTPWTEEELDDVLFYRKPLDKLAWWFKWW